MVEIMSDGGTRPNPARTDWSVVDAATEADIARQTQEDSNEAAHDAAAWAREVSRSVGLSQTDFSRCIGVPVAKVHGWESGKQAPAGPERTLLRLIAYSPGTALAALAR